MAQTSSGQGTPGRKRKANQPPALQLRSGRHGLPRSFVAKNQRERIMSAIAEAVAELGYPSTSVEDIVSRAGVSRRTFYDFFRTKDEAYLEAYEAVSSRLYERVACAYLAAKTGPERLRETLRAFLEFIASEPEFAHMCIVDVLSAGTEALDRRDGKMREFATLFEQSGINEADWPLPPLTSEALVGGVYEVVYKRVLRSQTEELPSLLPDLYYFCMVPYLGRKASHELYLELVEQLAAERADEPADEPTDDA